MRESEGSFSRTGSKFNATHVHGLMATITI